MITFWPFLYSDKEKYQIRETTPFGHPHYGNDYAPRIVNKNIAIIACQEGELSSGKDGYGGLWQYIKGIDGRGYMNVHQDRLVRRSGHVRAGELIGYMGNTGKSTGMHDHLTVRTNYNDPASSVDADRQGLIYYDQQMAQVKLTPPIQMQTVGEVALRETPDTKGKVLQMIPANTLNWVIDVVEGENVNQNGIQSATWYSWGGAGWVSACWLIVPKADCSPIQKKLDQANAEILKFKSDVETVKLDYDQLLPVT